MNTVTTKESLYGVFDKLSGHVTQFFTRSSDAIAVRDIIFTLRYPLKDTVLLKFGDFETSIPADSPIENVLDCFTKSDWNLKIVPWDTYKLPETTAEALAPLGLSPDEVKKISEEKINKIENMR